MMGGMDEEPTHEPRPSRLRRSGRTLAAGGRAAATGGRAALTGARRFTHAQGAGESGLSRLLELHAFNTAGDAAMAVSLAGTLFFTVPSEEAASQVALFLVLTMLPFAFVAPLIGPFLDRFRHGRRWAIGATLATRAFCCWVLAGAVADESTSFFVAALACLVSSKAYGVTRAAAVPRLLPDDFTLVQANSRVSLTGTAAAAISAPVAVGAAAIGPEWSLRYAFVLFVIGTVLAVLLPSAVDSTEGEEHLDDSVLPSAKALPPAVVTGLRANSGLRVVSGFLTIYLAFVLRDPPDSLGWTANSTILLGLVIGGAGVGNTLGVVVGNLTKSRRPQRAVLACLAIDVAAVVAVGLIFTWWSAIILGVCAGLCQSYGKLSLDATIQRDIPERIRTSVFARSETLIQLSWVIGGLAGIGLYTLHSAPRLSFAALAVALIAWLAFVLRATLGQQRRDDHQNGQARRRGDGNAVASE